MKGAWVSFEAVWSCNTVLVFVGLKMRLLYGLTSDYRVVMFLAEARFLTIQTCQVEHVGQRFEVV